MTDKEILAELKKCYELLKNILDNQYKQLESTEELEKMQNVLADKYYELYERIKQEEDISLYYEEGIRIAPYINADYINENNEYIASGVLNWQKWWEDIQFLTEF